MNQNGEELARWVRDARARTCELVADLTDEQLRVPLLDILNPFVWEIGHVAWFQEHWVLRHAAGAPPLLADADRWYDSMAVAHDTRWELDLPSREKTLAYMDSVCRAVEASLRSKSIEAKQRFFNLLAIFHEDMHGEAFTYTRQTLGYPAPKLSGCAEDSSDDGALTGDAEVPGGTLLLGAPRDDAPFVFDNEQWAHPVELRPFAMARAPVTQAELVTFVEEGGYRHREFWCEDGWAWRVAENAKHPLYFVREGDGWHRRHFDRNRPIVPHRPGIHVNWYEANAYCRWARRRLPTEAEWEAAAACEPDGDRLSTVKRRFPWGDAVPSKDLANLDSTRLDTCDVGALAGGDSAFGCRQMLGNVWEWTSSVFEPYPGFEPGPYRDYSEPWFSTRRVLRGGAWATRSRMVTNTYRNYFTPERRDVFAGFRTCRLD
jgi:iron(II)-dependent oxidoreductase